MKTLRNGHAASLRVWHLNYSSVTLYQQARHCAQLWPCSSKWGIMHVVFLWLAIQTCATQVERHCTRLKAQSLTTAAIGRSLLSVPSETPPATCHCHTATSPSHQSCFTQWLILQVLSWITSTIQSSVSHGICRHQPFTLLTLLHCGRHFATDFLLKLLEDMHSYICQTG